MADECDLTPYDEVADMIERLPQLVRDHRRLLRLSMRQAAADAGLAGAGSTIMRAEQGAGLHSETIVALLRWIARTDPRSRVADLERQLAAARAALVDATRPVPGSDPTTTEDADAPNT